jgi:circadian clock protein KaiB
VRPRTASPRRPVRGARVQGAEGLRRKLDEAGRHGTERYVLRLYVTGTTPGSQRAIERVRAVCEQHLKGRYGLEVIDIYQLPALARHEQIIATPTLIKVLPAPLRRFIGDLSTLEKILFGLDVVRA